LLVCLPIFTKAQASDPQHWAVSLSDDYYVLPDITYSTANNHELKLDLYLPGNPKQPAPTLIFIHGGGWVEGKKEYMALKLLPFMAMGFAVANVEYRLASSSPAPAAVEDCRCALGWVIDHAKDFKLDTARIVLAGNSAGGHLALITGMLPPQNPFDRQCPHVGNTRFTEGTQPPLKVAAIINFYGITDLPDLLDGPNAKHYAIEWFGSISNRDELARQVSPINNVRADLPPIITIHGDKDNIVPYSQAVRLHAALDKAGVPNRLLTIPGRSHGGFSKQEDLNSFDEIQEFLRKYKILEDGVKPHTSS
jgi:acetyl esterase/lipase